MYQGVLFLSPQGKPSHRSSGLAKKNTNLKIFAQELFQKSDLCCTVKWTEGSSSVLYGTPKSSRSTPPLSFICESLEQSSERKEKKGKPPNPECWDGAMGRCVKINRKWGWEVKGLSVSKTKYLLGKTCWGTTCWEKIILKKLLSIPLGKECGNGGEVGIWKKRKWCFRNGNLGSRAHSLFIICICMTAQVMNDN